MVVKITDIEAKQELLETNFHQIFHISLTNPFIDSDIINEWYNELLSNNNQVDDEDIINYMKNIETSTEDEYNFQQVGLCVNVVDGNTLILDTGEYISIAGAKAPNVNTVEGRAVKTAVEGVCLNKSIGICTDSNVSIITYNIDEEQQKGINLNKILIKEKMCQYSPTLSDTINNILEPESDNQIADISEQTNQFVNITIPLEKICDKNNTYGLGALYNFFNKDFNNILITNIDDYSIIHKCEVYQDVLFIRLQSYVDTIALHILPKIYDTSDDLLLVRDVMNGWSEEHTDNYYNRHYKDGVNLYFQMKYNNSGIITDRLDLYKPYDEFSSLIDSETMSYALTQDGVWESEPYQKTYGEYFYDIRPYNLRNVQINVGYKYNTSSSANTVHYTGTKDITNEDYNDRRTLIDCNLDNFTLNDHKISNAIHKLQYKDNNIVFPEHISVLMNIGFINKTGLHSQNIGKLYHKTIKYYNDSMYSEEFDGEATKYMFSEYDGTYYISLNSDINILSPDEITTLSAKIIDINESPVSGQKISFYKNGQLIGSSFSDQQGIATMKYKGDGTDNTDTFVAQTVYHIPSNEINIINMSVQRVEYVESADNEQVQAINTKYILKANDIVDVIYSYKGSFDYSSVFGARQDSYQHLSYNYFCRFARKDQNCYSRTGQEKKGALINQDTIYRVVTDQRQCDVYDQNGDLIDTIQSEGIIESCGNPCGIFSLNKDTSNGFEKDTNSIIKIYAFKIIDDNCKIKRYMIPARQNNIGGLYDLVSKTFYTEEDDINLSYGDDITHGQIVNSIILSSKSLEDHTIITATVFDDSSQRIPDININFYKGDILIGTTTTNYMGEATIRYNHQINTTSETLIYAVSYQIQSNTIPIRYYYVNDSLTTNQNQYVCTKGEGTLVFDNTGLQIQGTGHGEPTYWYYVDDLPDTNYVVEIDYIKDRPSSTFEFIIEDLIITHISYGNFRINSDFNNDLWNKIEANISNIDYTENQTLKFEVYGDEQKNIKIYYNDQLLYTANNIRQTKKQGFQAWSNDIITVKNLKIYSRG